MRKKSVWGVFAVVVLSHALWLPRPAAAQESLNEGTLEVAGSVGVSSGLSSVDRITGLAGLAVDLANLAGARITTDPGSVTKWNFGASVGYVIKPNLMVIGEFVHTRLANPTFGIQTVIPTTLKLHLSMSETTGGAQYNIPIRVSKVAPFVGAALGFTRSTIGVKESPFNVLDVDRTETDFTANFGGGVRYYISPRWGIRPELKVVHVPDETFVRTSVSVFVQFGK